MLPSLMGVLAKKPVSGYATTAVTFDTDYITNASPTGIADSTKFTCSGWVKPAADGGFQSYLYTLDGRFGFIRHSDNRLSISSQSTSGATLFSNYINATPFLAASGWTHFAISRDSGINRWQVYINGVEDTFGTWVAGTMDFTAAGGMRFGANNSATNFLNSDIADFYFNIGESLDLSTDITKFIASGKPVDLGADGSTPTGTAPIIFFKGNATTFPDNLGTGGAFTVTGTLANATTSPSD